MDVQVDLCLGFFPATKIGSQMFFSINKLINVSGNSKEKCVQNSLPFEEYFHCLTVKQPLSKRPKISFPDQLLLNAGQKYCRMLQGEHSKILLSILQYF